jgi:hypothetical protein
MVSSQAPFEERFRAHLESRIKVTRYNLASSDVRPFKREELEERLEKYQKQLKKLGNPQVSWEERTDEVEQVRIWLVCEGCNHRKYDAVKREPFANYTRPVVLCDACFKRDSTPSKPRFTGIFRRLRK